MKHVNVVILTMFIILGMISLPTIYKVIDKHNKERVLVVKNEFWYQAKKCYNRDECEDKVYLKDLYEKKYLEEKLVNPLNKKYYDENSYVEIEENIINLFD